MSSATIPIVESLHAIDEWYCETHPFDVADLCQEAAAFIEAQAAEIARLREARRSLIGGLVQWLEEPPLPPPPTEGPQA